MPYDFKKPPQSYWLSSTEETSYPSLEDDVSVDVAIVGGGIAGITSGYLLKKEGLKVAVLEADRICQGTTGHTTAKITSQHSLIYANLKKESPEKARQYAEANEKAIEFIANLVKEKNIDCDFSYQPSYIYTMDDNYVQQIADEAEAASSLGIKATYLEEIPLPLKIKAAVRFDNQAQFHPRKYLLKLAEEIPGDGSHIFENTKVVDIEKGDILRVVAANGKKVSAKKVIIASHYPFYDIRGLYFTRIYTERSYIVASLIKEKFPGGMYINAEEPVRSFRSVPYDGKELILTAGEHHKTGHGENMNSHYEALIDQTREVFTLESVEYRWSTQDCMTLDKIPYVGQHNSLEPNIYIATGFGKWGMTNGTVSGMILRDLIVKGESPWSDVYDPLRPMTLKGIGSFLMINAEVAEKLIRGKISPLPKDVDVKRGEGKTILLNGQKVGAFRDENNTLYLVDTTCTHLGCETQWNDAERSWDCPCHGSRFSYDGEILEGPTTSPLRRVKIEE